MTRYLACLFLPYIDVTAFFESYFSNYIEGTEFELEDAREIIETGQPMPARNADSHDILGTFQIVASKREMRRTPQSPDDLIDILQERHPFSDGNGRISRIMMNAELVHADQAKVIIPTVFHDDYLNALRRLTRKGDPSVIIRVMSRVRQFSANIVGDDFNATKEYLDKCFAFKEGEGYILRF